MRTYAMFTDEGNEMVDALVTACKMLEYKWPQVSFALEVMARKPEFSEATDTAVRESVYCAMGFDKE